MSATKTTVVAVLVLVLTFTAGFVAGVAVHRVLQRERHVPRHAATMMAGHLDRRLDLTDQQRAQVEAILVRRHARINEMWSGMHPRVNAEVEATNAEIAKVLTPEQRAKFETLKMRMRHRRGTGQTAPTR